ncbi:MAG TPA: hypothetical protein VHS06_09375 [Chloroflexota bacterium]|nr:hypothetical protein [Chloroflexota bacterium]
MYWAEAGVGSNRIMRANLDGSGSERLLTTSSGYPCGLTLDLVNDQMYWLNLQTSTMYRSNLDGTGTVQVLKTGVSPVDLALDVAGGKVYWTENGASYPAYDVIKRANLDGTGIETIVTGLWNPLGIALDLSARKVYWADHGQGKIQRANLDGTGIEDILTGLGTPEFIALVPEPSCIILVIFGVLVFAGRRKQSPDNVGQCGTVT